MRNDINSPIDYNQDFFVEENIPVEVQFKINPNGLPLLNGSNAVVLEDGSSLELTKDMKVSIYGNKILIQKGNNTIFSKDVGDDFFKSLIPVKERVRTYLNHKYFEKSGNIIISLCDYDSKDSKVSHLINGKEYTIEGESADMTFDNCDVFLGDDKLYVVFGSGRVKTYLITGNRLILQSESLASNSNISFLSNGDLVQSSSQKDTTTVSVNKREWKNKFAGSDISLQNDGKNIWFCDKSSVVLNDKKIDIFSESDNCTIHSATLSPDAKVFAIHVSQYGWNQGRSQSGPFIAIASEQGIQKEIPLSGGGSLYAIKVSDNGNLAYISKNQTKNFSLVIDGYEYPLNMKDDYHNVMKEFNFIDENTVNIKYLDLDNNWVHKHISLNKNAAEIQTALAEEAKEKQFFHDVGAFLKEQGISSLDQIKDIFATAKESPRRVKNYQAVNAELMESNSKILDLEKEKEKLTTEKETLQLDKKRLEEKIQTITSGITSGSFGQYKLSPDVKNVLGK